MKQFTLGDIVVSNMNIGSSLPNGIKVGILHEKRKDGLAVCFDPSRSSETNNPTKLGVFKTLDGSNMNVSGGGYTTLKPDHLRLIGTTEVMFQDYVPHSFGQIREKYTQTVNVWAYEEGEAPSGYIRFNDQQMLVVVEDGLPATLDLLCPEYCDDDIKVALAKDFGVAGQVHKYVEGHVSGFAASITCSRLGYSKDFQTEDEFESFMSERTSGFYTSAEGVMYVTFS